MPCTRLCGSVHGIGLLLAVVFTLDGGLTLANSLRTRIKVEDGVPASIRTPRCAKLQTRTLGSVLGSSGARRPVLVDWSPAGPQGVLDRVKRNSRPDVPSCQTRRESAGLSPLWPVTRLWQSCGRGKLNRRS
jgi:hypothetical protein